MVVGPDEDKEISPKIFVSYRRKSCADIVGRIVDHLMMAFGEDSVFLDIEDIRAGERFEGRLDEGREALVVCLLGVVPILELRVYEAQGPLVVRLSESVVCGLVDLQTLEAVPLSAVQVALRRVGLSQALEETGS